MPDQDAQRKIRVVMVEDENLYRDLLRIVLSQHALFDIVGAFPDGKSVLAAAPSLKPQVAMLDIELGSSMNGIQVGLRLRELLPKIGVILLSNHEDPYFLTSVPREAVAGWSYLLKKSVSDVGALTRAIEGAAAGFVVLDPQLVSGRQPRAKGLLGRLTPRQREILSLIAQGFTNAAIAQRLGLSEKSIENQTTLLYQQLEIDRSDSSVQPRVRAVLRYLSESQPRVMGETTR